MINRVNNTRIAPTPSGFLHIGNILSFAITSALAQKNNAKVLLRIDDLDQLRINNHYLQDIFDTLNYLEIAWDIGPRNVQEFQDSWSQTQRMELYHAAISELCNRGIVYACTCSRQQMSTAISCTCLEKQIPLDTENANLRLITKVRELQIRTYSGEIIRTALPAEMHNFIIRRKDGIPSYQLASAVDDLHYNIDLVVRGEDLWPSTVAQHELALSLGENKFNQIRFYHHSLLMEASGKKLSKSAGSTSIKYLRENGNTPSAIYTMIGEMLGIDRRIGDWKQLVDIISPDLNL